MLYLILAAFTFGLLAFLLVLRSVYAPQENARDEEEYLEFESKRPK